MTLFKSTIELYRTLEPGDTDAWSPLEFEKEVWHRNRICQQLRAALVAAEIDVTKQRFLDVGCGVGRSTRVLLEFGIAPHQITGLDLRPGAISAARRAHPGIDFIAVDELDAYHPDPFDWVMQCTVFSSLPTLAERRALAAFMTRVAQPRGYVFWWDRLLANGFAGGDALQPQAYFSTCEVVRSERVSTRPMLYEAIRSNRFGRRALQLAQRLVGFAPSHQALLLRTP